MPSLASGKDVLHRLGEHVRGGVAQHVQAVRRVDAHRLDGGLDSAGAQSRSRSCALGVADHHDRLRARWWRARPRPPRRPPSSRPGRRRERVRWWRCSSMRTRSVSYWRDSNSPYRAVDAGFRKPPPPHPSHPPGWPRPAAPPGAGFHRELPGGRDPRVAFPPGTVIDTPATGPRARPRRNVRPRPRRASMPEFRKIRLSKSRLRTSELSGTSDLINAFFRLARYIL